VSEVRGRLAKLEGWSGLVQLEEGPAAGARGDAAREEGTSKEDDEVDRREGGAKEEGATGEDNRAAEPEDVAQEDDEAATPEDAAGGDAGAAKSLLAQLQRAVRLAHLPDAQLWREREKEKQKREREVQRLVKVATDMNDEYERGAAEAELKGVLMLASCPEKDVHGHDVLSDLTCRLRKERQLVAAGWANDILHKNLPDGKWKDAYLGKLDAYLRAAQAADVGVHIITIRGGPMCNWERGLLMAGDSQADAIAEFDKNGVIKAKTHFGSREQFESWLDRHSDILKTLAVPQSTQEVVVRLHTALREAQDRANAAEEALENVRALHAQSLASLVKQAQADMNKAEGLLSHARKQLEISVQALPETISSSAPGLKDCNCREYLG